MGFGLLFLGYFFLLSLPVGNLDLLPDVIGWYFMFISLRRLSYYCPDNRHFTRARITVIPAAVISVIYFVVKGFLIPEGPLPDDLQTPMMVLQLGYGALIGVYEVFLLLGIHRLSREVELPKLASRAQRLLALTAVYYLAQLFYYSGILQAMLRPLEAYAMIMNTVGFAIYLLSYIFLILTLALLFTCYMRICLEGDENMPYQEDLFDKLLARLRRKK